MVDLSTFPTPSALRPVVVGIRTGLNLGEQEQSGERLDVPTATGEDDLLDTVYDTAVEQPEWAEDDEDLWGPSIGEVSDALGFTDNLDPTEGDDSGLSGQSGVRIVVVGIIVLIVVYTVGQLFTFNVGVGD